MYTVDCKGSSWWCISRTVSMHHIRKISKWNSSLGRRFFPVVLDRSPDDQSPDGDSRRFSKLIGGADDRLSRIVHYVQRLIRCSLSLYVHELIARLSYSGLSRWAWLHLQCAQCTSRQVMKNKLFLSLQISLKSVHVNCIQIDNMLSKGHGEWLSRREWHRERHRERHRDWLRERIKERIREQLKEWTKERLPKGDFPKRVANCQRTLSIDSMQSKI